MATRVMPPKNVMRSVIVVKPGSVIKPRNHSTKVITPKQIDPPATQIPNTLMARRGAVDEQMTLSNAAPANRDSRYPLLPSIRA